MVDTSRRVVARVLVNFAVGIFVMNLLAIEVAES